MPAMRGRGEFVRRARGMGGPRMRGGFRGGDDREGREQREFREHREP